MASLKLPLWSATTVSAAFPASNTTARHGVNNNSTSSSIRGTAASSGDEFIMAVLVMVVVIQPRFTRGVFGLYCSANVRDEEKRLPVVRFGSYCIFIFL
jgi:hypothetical protein